MSGLLRLVVRRWEFWSVVIATALLATWSAPLALFVGITMCVPVFRRIQVDDGAAPTAAGHDASTKRFGACVRSPNRSGKPTWRQVRAQVNGTTLEMSTYWLRRSLPSVELDGASVTAQRTSDQRDFPYLKPGLMEIVLLQWPTGPSQELAVNHAYSKRVTSALAARATRPDLSRTVPDAASHQGDEPVVPG